MNRRYRDLGTIFPLKRLQRELGRKIFRRFEHMTSVVLVKTLPIKCETTESIRKIQAGDDRDQQQAYQIPLVTRPFPIVFNDREPGRG